ncbi:hypothetical protein [Spongiimicrobium salis]|uniref:hypothetical protein n=1 Tax=Spongiimicrobium salis TaxID=1667022 RepID=UPI00374DD0A1
MGKQILIEKLPEEIKKLAMEEHIRQKKEKRISPSIKPKYLDTAFFFDKSLFGKKYWEGIQKRFCPKWKMNPEAQATSSERTGTITIL